MRQQCNYTHLLKYYNLIMTLIYTQPGTRQQQYNYTCLLKFTNCRKIYQQRSQMVGIFLMPPHWLLDYPTSFLTKPKGTLYFVLGKSDKSGAELKEDWHPFVLSLMTRPSNNSSTKPEGTLYFVLGNSDESGAKLFCILFLQISPLP